jgi:hypothetical protein
MDKIIINRKHEIDEKSENDDSVESQTRKSATVFVPFTSKPKNPKKCERRQIEIQALQ